MRPRLFVILLPLLLAAAPPVRGESPFDGEAGQGLGSVWRQALGGAVIGLPAAQAGSVVMACEGGMLKAYSWQGRALWTYYTRGRLAPFVSRSLEGTSYIARTSGTLIAVNRAGRELWQIDLGDPLSAAVLPGWDGRIFVFAGERIFCYTAAGYPLWRKTMEAAPALTPVMDLRGGFITAFEKPETEEDAEKKVEEKTEETIKGRAELIRFNAFGAIRSRELPVLPALAVSLRLPGAGELSIFAAYPNGSMEIHGEYLDAPPKTFETILPDRPLAAAARGGRVALALKDGRVVLVDGSGGGILWTGQSHIGPGEFSGLDQAGRHRAAEIAMIYDERGIYVLSRTGASGFTEDGRRLWIIRLEGAAALPAFSDEGVLYSGGRDWILYAYRPEERVRAQAWSLYGPVPAGSYGTGSPPPSSQADYQYRFNEDEMAGRLERIREDLERGQTGNNEREYAAYLMEIAGSLPNPVPRSPPVHVFYRAEAARLLAFLGSRETLPFLAGIFTRDPDPAVKAAAADAIGRIGTDPDGIALRAFTVGIFPPAPIQDEQVLTSVAAAVGSLCRFTGPPLSDDGIRLLTALSSSDRPHPVRTRALRELQSLKQ